MRRLRWQIVIILLTGMVVGIMLLGQQQQQKQQQVQEQVIAGSVTSDIIRCLIFTTRPIMMLTGCYSAAWFVLIRVAFLRRTWLSPGAFLKMVRNIIFPCVQT
jgi:uncharacterized BrkB/YihY/UPF0761 family membrane protein